MLARLFRMILRTFFREITVSGLENLPAQGPLIFAPNHPNALVDPLLMFMLPEKYRIRFVAKAPLFNIPLLGWLMGKMGVIPVIRPMDTSRRVDYSLFFSACLKRLAAGDSIVIFPEGVSRPHPHMARFRTGAARLFCMARAQGIPASIVPVGINYEYGALFRSPVMVTFGRPLATDAVLARHAQNPREAARQLTRALGRALDQLVFQADTLRDRELMLLLERIYRPSPSDAAWPRRVARLQEFAAALQVLRRTHPQEIRELRGMLMRYGRREQWLRSMAPPGGRERARPDPIQTLWMICGFPLAALGWMLTIVPYRLCRLLVTKNNECDESATATYKILYGLVLFPLAFVIEGILVQLSLGGLATWLFALLIVPLSYFTLFYFEWIEARHPKLPLPRGLTGCGVCDEVSTSMFVRQQRITRLVESLQDDFRSPSAHHP